MHIEMIAGTIKGYMASLTQNAFVKFILGIVPGVAATIVQSHRELINLVFLLYFLDFITGIACALKERRFSSAKFFKGAIKITTYGILLAVAISLDRALYTGEMIIGIMFSYIILTDSSSIIENLHKLGFNVPIFLIKYIEAGISKLDDKVGNILDVNINDIKNENTKTKNNEQNSITGNTESGNGNGIKKTISKTRKK